MPMLVSVLDQLVKLLALERIEDNLFRGQSQDLGWGRVYGGQVLGQALSAASQTVPEDRPVHSLHAYFLRPGDATLPIVYEVDRIRDGKSFTTRRVVAIQKGRPIFNLSSSFQIEEAGFEHQVTMPTVPGPDNLESESELSKRIEDHIPAKLKPIALAERPIETRPVRPYNHLQPKPSEPYSQSWCKAAGKLPDDPSVHRYMLAYASDYGLLTTALQFHGASWLSSGIQIASLDHAMWFHRPFRMDEWFLYSTESTTAVGARGLVRGQFFDRGGRLIASCMQEGLIRQR